MSFEPAQHLIDIDDKLDIAVYSLSDIQAAAAHVYPHTAAQWPPEIDSIRRILSVAGTVPIQL